MISQQAILKVFLTIYQIDQNTVVQLLCHFLQIQTSLDFWHLKSLRPNSQRFVRDKTIQDQKTQNKSMLKIKRKSLLHSLNNPKGLDETMYDKKSNIYRWVQSELETFKYSLSDENSHFQINQVLREQDKLIVLEMYVKPKIGIFADIQFRPKMYISCLDLVRRPKIYNDRRIYHPNISIESLQIIFPELVLDWNPTRKLQALMKTLNYILIEPNISFIPNNEYNKKAGICYHFKRHQYRQTIFENMPLTFDRIFDKNQSFSQTKTQQPEKIPIETPIEEENMKQMPKQNQKKEPEWFNIKSLYPAHIFYPKVSCLPNKPHLMVGKRQFSDRWKEQEEIKLLSKEMKKIHVLSDTETQKMEIE